MMALMLSCREATRLLLEGENRPLGPVERLSLRAHMAICTACTRFEGQVSFMRGAMKQWRGYRDGSDGSDDGDGGDGGDVADRAEGPADRRP